MLTRSLYVLAAAALVVLLLLQLQGPWVIFKLQQQAIRSEVKRQIKAGVPEEDLVKLKIAKAWEKESNARFYRIHSREFRFDGEMYDIVRSEDRGDTTLYVCIHDVKEGGLFAELEEMIEEEIKHPISESKRKQIEEWLSLKYCNYGVHIKQVSAQNTLLWPEPYETIVSVETNAETPPPEYCFHPRA